MRSEISIDDIVNGISERCTGLKDLLKSLDPIVLAQLRESKKKEDRILKRYNHMKRVALISKEIIFELEKIGYKFSQDEIKATILGAYVHDIKKFHNDNSHSYLGAEFIKSDEKVGKILGSYKDLVSDIVMYHKEGEKKKKGNMKVINEKNSMRRIEIRIVQDADKISSIYKENKNIEEEMFSILNGRGLNFKESKKYLRLKVCSMLDK
ncbi:HD domain-containing protein [Clostridium frigidicarnis]|uniref:HD domain-containing protein n=1 Tax=Clostridium frigidicarnis TaxID=84698 RepID=A0A1I0XJH4_9CLOT|nr:HD domain-containing protein [Clostridium frigidicarnis]SFB00470.1 HD domain-containing protein [Clostridium frigidicarnis]